MKKLLFFLVLIPQLTYATIKITDIETRLSLLDNNPITVYFTMENTGKELDYLYKVIVNNHPGSKVSIHKTVIEKGVARIIKIDRLSLPADIKFISKKYRTFLIIEGLDLNIKNYDIKFIFANNPPIIKHNNKIRE